MTEYTFKVKLTNRDTGEVKEFLHPVQLDADREKVAWHLCASSIIDSIQNTAMCLNSIEMMWSI